MLFNSLEFILLFFPITLVGYFLLNRLKLTMFAKGWLVLASLYFYSYWKIDYLPTILFSMIFNYSVGSTLVQKMKLNINRKVIFSIGVIGNVLLLGYFKYFDFIISNINSIFHQNFNYMNIVLPLGISFFTFQQISYLVDSYKKETKEYDFLNYALFVTFFPQLIAGPIVHHKEMMPQFESLRNKFLNWKNIYNGLSLFAIGLFKKVIIADTVAKWAIAGFGAETPLTFLESWITMLSYTFQIYYDFSGYTDMALGLGMMFNIMLPQNFNNPYCALSIQDFWHRWHMTLSKFLKDYLYIPLGGNRKGSFRTYINLFTVFFTCGLWHGASWMFVSWGILHGVAIIVNKFWQKICKKENVFFSWILTFVFINFSWVIFNAKSWNEVKNIYKGALGLNTFAIPNNLEITSLIVLPLLILIIFIKCFYINKQKTRISILHTIFISFLIYLCICFIAKPSYISPFIYFNF